MSANSQLMEHRWGSRVKLGTPAALRSTEGVTPDVSVQDASLSGAFVKTGARLPLFSKVSIRPITQTGDWLDAWVVRVEDTGMGLEWLHPGQEAVAAFLASRRTISDIELQEAALDRARSEVASGEFDMQG